MGSIASHPPDEAGVGGGWPLRSELEQIFAGTNTHFVGYLQGDDLASAFASSDVFLFPSRTETLGLVLLEAMAAGCPVVAARAGGIPDIVSDGVNGYLFDPDREDGLIVATQNLLGQDTAHLKERARSEAERWGWAEATKQLQTYYDRVIRDALS